MPELEDVFEIDDGYASGDSEEDEDSLGSRRELGVRNGTSNRLAIRHAIEARREQKRIARDLDSIEFDIDDY